MAFVRERVAGYKRIRRVEFGDLPKTISGKIRRVELRAQEDAVHQNTGHQNTGHQNTGHQNTGREGRGVTEFWEEDFTW
jgi:acetyl-CoA synthetase